MSRVVQPQSPALVARRKPAVRQAPLLEYVRQCLRQQETVCGEARYPVASAAGRCAARFNGDKPCVPISPPA
jgi:hypothetical protein